MLAGKLNRRGSRNSQLRLPANAYQQPCTHLLLRLALCRCRNESCLLSFCASPERCKLTLLLSAARLQLSKPCRSGSTSPRCVICSCCRRDTLLS